MSAERDRVAGFGKLEDGLRQAGDWYRWGPYVSERQCGTVREDYIAGPFLAAIPSCSHSAPFRTRMSQPRSHLPDRQGIGSPRLADGPEGR